VVAAAQARRRSLRRLSADDWTSAADQSADQSVPRVTFDPSRALIAEMPASFEWLHAMLAILYPR